jgi:FKBP-type peptidyl-prolyl cis-trans isomerase SlyD
MADQAIRSGKLVSLAYSIRDASGHVTKIEGGRLTVDGNHPPAGRELRVKVDIKEVRDPTGEELAQDLAQNGMAQTESYSLH